MASRFVFTPFSAEFGSSGFPELRMSNGRPVLAFDATTDETCYWTTVAPQGITGTMYLVVYYAMASATSNAVVFQAAVESITPGDATDTDATTSFDTANSNSGSVPATAGYLESITVTLTNADSMAAGDYVRFRLNRDADSGSDTATGDCYVFAVEFRDSA